MRVPKDQGLALTIFAGIFSFFIVLFWIFLPPTISFEEEDEDEVVRVLGPEEAVFTAEEILAQAEASLAELEAEEDDGEGPEEGEGSKDGEGPKEGEKE